MDHPPPGYPPPGQPPRGPLNPDQPVSGQPMSGQPMSGQPGHDPGYAAPGHGPPPPPPAAGYGPPGYGPPGYGPPGYGPPGYGPPGYGPPGYGPPGQYPPSPDERNMAMLGHLLGLATGLVLGLPFLGPLVIYLMKKDESRYVRHHAADALNLTLTGLIVTVGVSLVGCVLTFVVIGFFLFLLLIPYGIMLLIFMVIAAMAANRGEWYSYPAWLRIPMVR